MKKGQTYTRFDNITQDVARMLFHYDKGELYWKTPISASAKVGSKAGYVNKANGYVIVRISGVNYRVHRIIWVYIHGYMPENGIDHIDRDRQNNNIWNLREVSHMCNMRNAKQRESSSGIKGISWSKREKKWKTYIRVNQKDFFLGTHSCKIEASCHRLAAEQSLNWSGCDSSSPSFLVVRDYVKKGGDHATFRN